MDGWAVQDGVVHCKWVGSCRVAVGFDGSGASGGVQGLGYR